MQSNTQDITRFCEAALTRHKEFCLSSEIHPGWPKIVDRMIEHRDELKEAYCAIYREVDENENSAGVFFNAVLCATNARNPEKLSNFRDAKKKLSEINEKIAERAHDLSSLLSEREDLYNSQPVYSSTHHHILILVEKAACGNYLFESWVSDKLKAIRQEFDTRYLPSMSDVISEIGRDAAQATPEFSGPVTSAALIGSRPSKADFFRTLNARIRNCVQMPEEGTGTKMGNLPLGFHLSDETWASLMNVLLDLDPDEIVDAAYIKRTRQRTREFGQNL